MGIKGLQRLIDTHASHVQITFPYLKYRTRVVAVDANILIYKFCHNYTTSISSFVLCFVYKILSFIKYGILPIFIFDGEAPHEKRKAVRRRFHCKNILRERLLKLRHLPFRNSSIYSQIQRLERQCFIATKQHKSSLMKLLDLLGIPYLVSKNEAEMLCALLQKQNMVDFTLSEDTDTYAFGCTHVLRMFRNSEKYLVETNFTDFLRSLQLTNDEFLNVCVLSGCDYIDHVIPYLNIQHCIEIVKEHHDLESCLNVIRTQYPHIKISSEEYNRVKSIYTFKHESVQEVVKQCQELNHDDFKTKFHTLKKFDEVGFKHWLSVDLSVNASTIQCLCNIIHNSFQDYSLIRSNFNKKIEDVVT
uniref:XPG N-terminal domain-containing protein n=1 Tax=viral metagenome TaxID=1070528 RepID=A0A6C0CQY7_9ZZZZ